MYTVLLDRINHKHACQPVPPPPTHPQTAPTPKDYGRLRLIFAAIVSPCCARSPRDTWGRHVAGHRERPDSVTRGNAPGGNPGKIRREFGRAGSPAMSHGIEGLELILEAEQWQTREDRREGGDFLRATRPIGGRYYSVVVRSIQGAFLWRPRSRSRSAGRDLRDKTDRHVRQTSGLR